MTFLCVGIAVLLSHFVEGVSGFGCMILALPVVASILGMKTAVPLLVILSTIFDVALVIKDWKHIVFKEAVRIATITGITMPLGFLILRHVNEQILSTALGCFMILLALWGLLEMRGRRDIASLKPQRWKLFFLPIAGVVQGAFGGSGPFIIVYAKEKNFSKTEFRGTMALVWVILNSINLIQYQMAGMISYSLFKQVVAMIPFLLVGFLAGIWVHEKVSKRRFNQIIYSILLIAGFTMVR